MKAAGIISILLAAAGVAGAGAGTYIPAAVCAVLYLIGTFIPLNRIEVKLILLTGTGFPLILCAGYAVTAGGITSLLLLSLVAVSGVVSRKMFAGCVGAGVAAGICAWQSSVLVAVVIAAVLAAAGVYILFIYEYRMRKQLRRNPHEIK